MKQTRFITVVIAALLLFCSSDIFAQRSRGGSSGGRGGSRSASSVSHSSSSSGSYGSYSSGSQSGRQCCHGSYGSYTPKFNNAPIVSIANKNSSSNQVVPSVAYFSKKDVLSSICPTYGYEVNKRRATKGSILISNSTGDYYYRNGIFFTKCPDSRKYAICKPKCGLHVPEIPASRRAYELNGTPYYYSRSTYYIYDESTLDFVVVTPPVGLVVDNVPCEAKEVIVDDEHYYIVGNVLYKEVGYKFEVAMLDKEALQQIKDFLASAK